MSPPDGPRLGKRDKINSSDGSELRRGDEIEPETGWHQPQIDQCGHGFLVFGSRGRATAIVLACENLAAGAIRVITVIHVNVSVRIEAGQKPANSPASSGFNGDDQGASRIGISRASFPGVIERHGTQTCDGQ